MKKKKDGESKMLKRKPSGMQRDDDANSNQSLINQEKIRFDE
jgi:hypothetical protein